jgi:hypothetical protein
MRHILAVSLALVALSAQAGPIAVAQSADGARVVLHDHAGPCVGAAKLAEYFGPDGTMVQGCWLAFPNTITVAFLDGERGTIPIEHLKKVTDS